MLYSEICSKMDCALCYCILSSNSLITFAKKPNHLNICLWYQTEMFGVIFVKQVYFLFIFGFQWIFAYFKFDFDKDKKIWQIFAYFEEFNLTMIDKWFSCRRRAVQRWGNQRFFTKIVSSFMSYLWTAKLIIFNLWTAKLIRFTCLLNLPSDRVWSWKAQRKPCSQKVAQFFFFRFELLKV